MCHGPPSESCHAPSIFPSLAHALHESGEYDHRLDACVVVTYSGPVAANAWRRSPIVNWPQPIWIPHTVASGSLATVAAVSRRTVSSRVILDSLPETLGVDLEPFGSGFQGVRQLACCLPAR